MQQNLRCSNPIDDLETILVSEFQKAITYRKNTNRSVCSVRRPASPKLSDRILSSVVFWQYWILSSPFKSSCCKISSRTLSNTSLSLGRESSGRHLINQRSSVVRAESKVVALQATSMDAGEDFSLVSSEYELSAGRDQSRNVWEHPSTRLL